MWTMSQSDTVTEAQRQLAVLCSHIYATIGALQRDAPPLAVKGEPLLGDPSSLQTPISEQTRVMAQQVVQASKQFEKLVSSLPDELEPESQQLATLQDLQQKHTEASQALEQSLQQAQDTLIEVQDAFADTADRQLQAG